MKALVVANAERANNYIAHALRRELARVQIPTNVLPDLEAARDLPVHEVGLTVIDAPSIGNDLEAAARFLPDQPKILLHDPATSGLADTEMYEEMNLLARPFRSRALSALAKKLFPDAQPMTPFTASPYIFFDGSPLKGLLTPERELLTFLIQQTQASSISINKPVYEQFFDAVHHLRDTDCARQVMRTFGQRLETVLPKLTNGMAALERLLDAEGRFTGYRLVSASNAPALTAG
jgi:hypothetical protein